MKTHGNRSGVGQRWGNAIALLLLLTANGCLMIPFGDRVTSPQKYPIEGLAFLDFPDTTRNEVVATLGLPFYESKQIPVSIYMWQQVSRALMISPFGKKIEIVEDDPQPKALFISFTPTGAVTAHEMRWLKPDPLEKSCSDWHAERHSP